MVERGDTSALEQADPTVHGLRGDREATGHFGRAHPLAKELGGLEATFFEDELVTMLLIPPRHARAGKHPRI